MEPLAIAMQLFFNTMIAGGMYALLATGYTVIQATLKFINFQHASMCALGGFIAYTFSAEWGVHLVLAVPASILIVGGLGVVIEKIGYKPLREAPSMSPLLTSLGFAIVIENFLVLMYGPWIKNFDLPVTKGIEIFGAIITTTQITVLVVSLFLLTILHFFVMRTRLGRAMRAVADDREIATAVGINVDRVISQVFALASALAAMSGILMGMERALYPGMVYPVLIRVLAASVLAGEGNISGAIVGSFLIGFVEAVGGYFISTQYTLAFTFILLIVSLLFNPKGLLGGK